MQKYIFNKYDIRGVVGTELVIEEVEQLTHAIISFYQKYNSSITKIAIAMDGRLHSQEIYKRVAQAIIDRGLQGYFLGVCPTPVFVFGLYRLPVQAGIMITGSHHSKEYNGFKLYLDKKSVYDTQIEEIYQIFLENRYPLASTPGKIVPSPILDQYVESIWQDFSHLSHYDFSMIIDGSHGVVGSVINKLIAKMKWKRVLCINDQSDGHFPMHDPDPCDIKNMQQLRRLLLKTDKAFGIGFDGDAGRMIAMEHDGKLILGDRLLALFAKDILTTKQNSVIIYDIRSSMLVREVVEKCNGQAIVSSVGAPLVKKMMEQHHALLGGEMSGHYFFKDRHPGYDDGIYALFRLLDILVKERKSLHELLLELPEKYSSDEIRIPCPEEQKHGIIKKIFDEVVEKKKWKISQVDGIRAETTHGWGLLRACNTQAMVSFRCEAKDKQNLLKVKNEFKELLKPYINETVLKDFF
ncbi:phosphomannomutase/phosphoglucomutase [Candidatus Dependentiae bacterium]|nr:phosphomannomutase/phosphoglucomutase [Candidatus Dependentiae bacterium]